ncbi:u box domain-containing protein [Stylonychia lemnae]|uniref:RING-type E3 ubiquitin transferase n=1 Tax=Stylonychia lemnae TaxID=5949 RepID=A0A077ZS06_STYLE|nr:u box domain-containing protein [Stylonychia lemnae]|eukprot:CDW72140.1 u box domain-containing protein [Stylonychia lemnae]
MGGGQSTQQNQEQQQNATQEQQKLSQEEIQRVRDQRTQALQKRIEEQRRAEQLAKQTVIDFKNPPNNLEETKSDQANQIKPTEIAGSSSKINVQEQILQQNNEKAQAQNKLLEQIQANKQKMEEQKPLVEQQKNTQTQQQQPKVGITKEQRIHNFISDIFQITNENSITNSNNKNKTFLYEYCGEGRQFKMQDLDDIIMSRLQQNKNENKFVYLFNCYRKIDSHLYVKEKIIENATEIKESIVSYFNTCLQLPETFNLTNNYTIHVDGDGNNMNNLMAMLQGGGQGMGMSMQEKLYSNQEFQFTRMQNDLWVAFYEENLFCNYEFLQSLTQILQEDEEWMQLFYRTLFNKMHLNLNSINIDKFRTAESYLEILKQLLNSKEAQELFVKNFMFYREGLNGKQIQMETYLGRYFSFSCLAHETRGFKDAYFKGIAKSQQNGIQRMTEQVSDQFHKFHVLIFDVMQKLLKNKECRDIVMKWLRAALSSNMDKQKMYTQIPVASDGFILNLIDVLLLFGKPFTSKFHEFPAQFRKVNFFYLMDDKFFIGGKKIEKINNELVELFISGQLLKPEFTGITQELNEESSLNSEKELNVIPQPNFITEIFFLAHIAISLLEKKIEKQYEELYKHINKAAGQKDIQTYEEMMGVKMCIDVHLLGKSILGNFRSLFTFTGALFISMTSQKSTGPYQIPPESFQDLEEFEKQAIELRQIINATSSNEESQLDLAAFPTIILTNLSNLPKLFRQYSPDVYYGYDLDLNVQVATNVTIINENLIKNPHIRADMIKFLAYLVPQQFLSKERHRNAQQDRDDLMYKDIFFRSYTLQQQLIKAVVNVYIDSERTGYYEKGAFRFYASMILEYIWQDGAYRQKFIEYGMQEPERFTEFCNFLINDVNNLLFEGLLELEEIRDFEELQSNGGFNQLDEDQRQQMQQKYDENTRKAKSHFQLSNMVVKLLEKVSSNVREPFITEELGEKFANAVNYCIDSLVSQKGLKLKINNPERFNFEPRELLINILCIYANMSEEQVFLQNVVKDSRSYKDETFQKALRLLQNPKKGVQIDGPRTGKFEIMVQKLIELKVGIDEEDTLFDDAPEHFLDPIMNTLMKDPVELPASNTIIDYMIIKKHLLNDPNDPFNRSPLKIEQLIPRPDIKQQIEEYKQKKRQEKMNA